METIKIPPLPEGAKCKKCKSRGEIRLESHNTIWCSKCFQEYCQTAVARSMEKFGIRKETGLLVAVSGGKDSLALWDILNSLGYKTRGLHVDLGIPVFSEASADAVSEFAQSRQLTWARHSLKEVFGWTVDEIRCRTRRIICSVCGTIKRQMLNRLTIREGYTTLASGHNLDDEAGRLLGNILRHRIKYRDKQYPYLPASYPLLPAKAKPLYRLESHEIRAYCQFASIRPHAAKCPFSHGATSHIVKEALDFLENRMPGTKRDFYYTYIKNRQPPVFEGGEVTACTQCGEPSYMEICSVCAIKSQLIAIREKEEARGEG